MKRRYPKKKFVKFLEHLESQYYDDKRRQIKHLEKTFYPYAKKLIKQFKKAGYIEVVGKNVEITIKGYDYLEKLRRLDSIKKSSKREQAHFKATLTALVITAISLFLGLTVNTIFKMDASFGSILFGLAFLLLLYLIYTFFKNINK